MTKKITIGADPEYGLQDNGRLVPPGQVIQVTNAFGVDGCSSIGEIRPNHATCPIALTKNIYEVLFTGVKNNPSVLNLKMKAGGMVNENALGGHIHFGEEGLLEEEARFTLNKALNKTLAVLVAMVEDEEEAINRRVGTPYGSIEDRSYNPQNWGVEYRVLPSWLTHPKECEAVLATSFIIASEFASSKIMDEACSLPGYDSQAFRECDKLALMYHLPPIVEFIKSLPLYDKYEEQVRYLFRMIKNREVWSCDKNMLDTWGLKEAVASKKEKVYA